jgi:outer membrane immunogenic protein
MKLRHGLFGLTLTSALALAALAANAADVYVPGPGGYKDGPVCCGPNWAGFYIGVNGGYSWSEVNVNSKNGFESPFIGAQAGYNFQRGNFVFGVEADVQGTGSSSSSPVASNHISINDWGTVTGRLGYSFGNALFFVKGGFAWGDVDLGTNPLSGYPPVASTAPTGYEIGAGIEYKVAPAWSFKVEYQYVDFGTNTFNTAPGVKVTDHVAFNAVMAGVNWHIVQEYVPLK